MGGCQNYGPLLGPLNTRCRIILRTQKGTIILTTTYMYIYLFGEWPRSKKHYLKDLESSKVENGVFLQGSDL